MFEEFQAKLRTHSVNAHNLYSKLTMLEEFDYYKLSNLQLALLISEIKLLIRKHSFDYALSFGDDLVSRFESAKSNLLLKSN
ncbi:hypothetical protein [Photobacterium damselae]|uniref:hypothetical protein n=1 Tax=Photobacterium damselae TaxID=38293 RepID=UPI00406847E8